MNKKVYPKVFGWLFIGLLITFLTGFYVCTSETMVYNVARMYFVFAIVEIILALFLGSRIHKMKYQTAIITYLIYCFISGLTFSSIFLLFQMSSILLVFGITSLLFGLFALFGYFTKVDLSKLGTLLLIGLFGLIIMVLINLFLGNSTFDIVISCIGLVIFFGYTAYDMQKIRSLSEFIDEDKVAIYGAFQLYLDFINIFIDLLRILGNSRD